MDQAQKISQIPAKKLQRYSTTFIILHLGDSQNEMHYGS